MLLSVVKAISRCIGSITDSWSSPSDAWLDHPLSLAAGLLIALLGLTWLRSEMTARARLFSRDNEV